MLVPDDPTGSRDAIDDDGNSMSGSEVAQCLKKKTQREKNGEQRTDERDEGGVGAGVGVRRQAEGGETGGVRFIKSLRRPNKPVGLFALRDARGDRLL